MSSCDNRSAKSNNAQSFIMIFLMLFSSFAVYVVQDMTVTPAILDDNNVVMYDGDFNDAEMVKDIYSGALQGYPQYLTAVGSTLYFSADDGTNGHELWKSDGTTAGTVMVKDIYSGTSGSWPEQLTVVGSTLYFQATDGSNGFELWKSDGTTAGTVMVKDINSGTSGSYPAELTVVGNSLVFRANDGSNGIELWKSNGTSAGTVMVKDINSVTGSSGDSSPSEFTLINDTFYFSADDGTNGVELWKSDGTANGTVMVKDINNGTSSRPTYLTAVGSTLYFRADDGTNGYELWKSIPSETSTMMVKDLNPGGLDGLGAYPDLRAVGNTLYFGANDGTNGDELWKSDGSSSGTVMVKDINPSGNSDTGYFRAVGNTLYFDATDGTNGHELWKSDGTPAGTVMVKNINPSGDSDPQRVTEINGMLYFRASDGTNGVELWKSDGTSSGTVMVKDINSGSSGSSLNYLTAVGNSLYFAANDGTNGVELWKATTTSTSSEVDIDSHIEFDNDQEKLIYGWEAFNLTAGTEYLIDWSLYYSGNESEIHNGVGDSYTPSSDQGSYLSSILLTSEHITRGLEYCVDSQISNSQNTPLDADRVVCMTIPNGSTGVGDDDVEIGAQLVFDVANSNLDLTYDGYNFTTTNSYSVNWSLYYQSNGSEIYDSVEVLSPPSSSFTNNFASYPLSNAMISRGLTYCLDINIFDSQGTSLSSDTKCATIPNGSNSGGGGTWATSTVDSGTSVGEYTSLAVDFNDDVHISYFDTSADDLKYATDSSGTWVSTAVDSDASAGEYNSLAVHSNGDVHISYYDSGNQDLKYATDSSGSWSLSAIDTGGDVGKHTSLAVDSNGGVHIAYYDLTNGALKYAHKPVDQWAISTIDSSGNTGRYTSLAIDSSDNVHISYYDVSNFDLMYATDSTGSWVTTRVDDVNNVGKFTSLAVDSNDDVHISYLDETNTDLRYATDSSGSWVTSVVDTDPIEATGYFSSLGVDSNDDVHISYFDQTSENLNYATDSNGSWVTSIVDSGGATGGFTSLGVDSNNDVHISYYDSTNTDLRYATTATSGGSSGDGGGGDGNGGNDGFNDAIMVTYLNLNSGSSPNNIIALDNTLYFFFDGGTNNGRELWKSDGTSSGTVIVKDINSGSGDSYNPSSPCFCQPRPTVVGNTLYFQATDGTNGHELWKSDGTSAGTVMVKDIFQFGDSKLDGLTAVGNILFFSANDGTNGDELWKSDGTAAGTVMVKDINLGANGSYPRPGSDESRYTVIGSTVYFRANDGTNGVELWKSDGTAAGTVMVKDINSGSGGSTPSDITAVGNTLYFYANDSINGYELWKSDGTTAGTAMVKDINPGSGSSNPFQLTAVGSMLYFRANDGTNGEELWKSDGTSTGTVMVKDINPGGNAFGGWGAMGAIGSTLYFDATDGTNGHELWKSDGTPAGTVMVKDIYSGSSSSSPDSLTAVGSTLYFQASDGTNGYELWKSDGTSAGTVMVKDINSGPDHSSPTYLTVVGSTLYFKATDGTNGWQLWKATNSNGSGDGDDEDLGMYLSQLFPQAAFDYVANSCDGQDDDSQSCVMAWADWCEENPNVSACRVVVEYCEDWDEWEFEFADAPQDASTGDEDTIMHLYYLFDPTKNQEELNWANLNIQIIGANGNPVTCEVGAPSSNCELIQYGADDTRWENTEVIHLEENGNEICDDDECSFTFKISDVRDSAVLAFGRYNGDGETITSVGYDIPGIWLDRMCNYLDIDDGDGEGDGSDNETEAESDEWWADIPVAGQVIEKIQTKYGKMISAAIFGLSVIGYGYRVVTIRSEMVTKKRMKKFEKRINAARTSSSLRRVQTDIEKAEEKKLLPTGGFGDLMSMIELRAEDLGLAEFLPDEKLVGGGTGISDDDFREGMDAMREAQEDMQSVAEQLRQQRSQREESRVAKKTPVKPNEDLVSMKDMATGGGISLPSYHPKDFNRDGKVDEEDERIWAAMSEEERISRSSSAFGSDGMTAQILAFSNLPSSSKSPCSCGSRKPYRKCHMNKDKCPCGSGKRFVSCCAEKRGFK